MSSDTWRVSHFYHNTSNNRVQTFDNKSDAIAAVRGISSDDPDDTQCSYIENMTTGEWGRRTWGKKNIAWYKKIA